MPRFGLILSTLLIICFLSIAAAQDSAPQKGTSQENACHEGGLFFRDGVSPCETEWHWECGWYIANGQATGAPVPDWCGTYDEPTIAAPVVGRGCLLLSTGIYVNFTDLYVMHPGAPTYLNNACSIENGGTLGMVYLYSEFNFPAVFDICIYDFTGTFIVLTDTANLYGCGRI